MMGMVWNLGTEIRHFLDFPITSFPLNSEIKIPVLLSRVLPLSKGFYIPHPPCNFAWILMPSLGGRAVLTCFVGVVSCFKAPGSHRVRGRAKICVPDLLRPVFFSLLCSLLKHPVLSSFQELYGEREDPEIQVLAPSPHLGQFTSSLLCLMCLPAPPLAVLMWDSPEHPPASQCWCHYVAELVKEIQ